MDSIYIDTAELLRRVPWSRTTLRRWISAGRLRLGREFFQPHHHTRILWKWAAVEAAIEGRVDDVAPPPRRERSAAINLEEATRDFARMLG